MEDQAKLTKSDQNLLRSHPFLSFLNQQEWDLLFSIIQVVPIHNGIRPIVEGEQANSLYIILSGTAEVYIHNPSGERLVLATLKEGDVIGEDALHPESKKLRSASVMALTDLRLAEIPFSFLEPLQSFQKEIEARRSAHTYDRMLKLMTHLNSVHIGEQDMQYVHEEFYQPESIIFTEGEIGKAIYFILKGSVRITKISSGKEKIIAQLGSGQCFGEVALLEEQERLAAAIAQEPTQLLRIDKDLFLKWYHAHPAFRDMLQSLKQVYRLRDDSLISVYAGQYEGKNCISTTRSQKNGQKFVSTKVMNEDIALFYKLSEEPPVEIKRFIYSQGEIKREIQIASDNTLIGVLTKGPWIRLNQVIDSIIKGEPIALARAQLFEQKGELNLEYASELITDSSIICSCMRVAYKDILSFITKNGDNTEKMISATGISLVCGACTGTLEELMGKSKWFNIQITNIKPIAKDTFLLQLKPVTGVFPDPIPGQHIILRAQIGKEQVQRSYTLSSAQPDLWEMIILKQPFGIMSNWLTQKSALLATLQSSPPRGDFVLKAQTKETVFFGAGIGVTPALAILQNNPSGFFLHYSATHEEDFIFREELSKKPNVTLRCTSQEGHLDKTQTEAILKLHPNANIMVCGSPEYNHALMVILKDLKIPDEQIRIEEFLPPQVNKG